MPTIKNPGQLFVPSLPSPVLSSPRRSSLRPSSPRPSSPRPLSRRPSSSRSHRARRTESQLFPARNADHCVVSSDGIAFGFTKSQFLQSPIFSEMVGDVPNTDIHLADREIESSSSIELLLRLLCSDRMGEVNVDTMPSLEGWTSTLLLAQKYGFAQAYMLGTMCCYMAFQRATADPYATSTYAIHLFCLAARLDEEWLAVEAVQRLSSVGNIELPLDVHTDQDRHGMLETALAQYDVSAWPVQLVLPLPTTYLWALGRAAQPSLYTNRPGGDKVYYSSHVRERFTHFLALAKKASSGT